MSGLISHIQVLAELWPRRTEPDADDVRRSLELARALNSDPASPTTLRALAWRVLGEIHVAAGWPLPEDEPLPLCSSAGASARHSSTLLVDAVLSELRSVDGPVLVAGALGAGRRLFGRWDAVPTAGALLVPLSGNGGRECTIDGSFKIRGVRWESPSPALRDAALTWKPVTLRDRKVRVPSLELLTACSGAAASRPEDFETMVFCTAAYRARRDPGWAAVEAVAADLGLADRPLAAAVRLGIDDWLDLDVSSAQKLGMSLKRLFVAPMLNRHGPVSSDRLP